MVRIDDLNVMGSLDVTRSHYTFAILAQAQCYFVTVVQLEHHALQVQEDVHHIFLHAIDGRVLMQNASNRDFRRCVTHHGRQQYAAQCIAQRMTIATLKRLQRHLGTIVTKLLDINRLGFQQICLHADFLSIPPARYTGKAGEAPKPRCLAV